MISFCTKRIHDVLLFLSFYMNVNMCRVLPREQVPHNNNSNDIFSEQFQNKRMANSIMQRGVAALLFWFFGGFRCGGPLFIVILVIYQNKNR